MWHFGLNRLRLPFRVYLSRIVVGALVAHAGMPECLRADDAARPADLVLQNGYVVTVDGQQPLAEALAIRGDRILAVGTNDAVAEWLDENTRVIDLDGRLTIPGFIEGHGHFVSLGESKRILDLTTAATWDEVIRMVSEATSSTAEGEWILGRGWHQAKWESVPRPNVDGYPVHAALSAASPNHPVLLRHASGHMSFANAMAMRLGGVTDTTPNPAGGEILRDRDGQAIGVFRETAQALVTLRRESEAEQARSLQMAIHTATDECLRHGVTSFHDAGSSFRQIAAFRRHAEQGRLAVRLWVMIRESNARLERELPGMKLDDQHDPFLTIGGIKRSIDGALGPHGAWLMEPYADLPGSSGLRTTSLSALRQTAALARKYNLQFCVHAIGDRANRETLNLFEAALAARSDGRQRRWRIEHAQHLHPDDVPRFAEWGVIASMQGIHCTSDAAFVVDRLGAKRAEEGAYLWQSLLRSGATVINGTDVPVESIDPIASFYASVERRLPDGRQFFPHQRMSREQALRSYTLDAAYAAFQEDMKGSLTPGKLADIVVLSENIMTCDADLIPEARIELTIIGGKVAYDRASVSTHERR